MRNEQKQKEVVDTYFWGFGHTNRTMKNSGDIADIRYTLFPERENKTYNLMSPSNSKKSTFSNGEELITLFSEQVIDFAKEKDDRKPCVAVVTMVDMEETELTSACAGLTENLIPGVTLVLMHNKEGVFDSLTDDRGLEVKKLHNHQHEAWVKIDKIPAHRLK